MRPCTVLATLLVVALPVACGVEARVLPAAREWPTLLADAPVRRLRAAVVVDARDCPAALEVVELFARPELAGAVGSVTLLVRDGKDSLARYADALLTAPVHLAVVSVPPRLRRALRALGPGPRLLLVDPRGQVVWASRIHATSADVALLAHAAARVADHYLATELATRPRP